MHWLTRHSKLTQIALFLHFLEHCKMLWLYAAAEILVRRSLDHYYSIGMLIHFGSPLRLEKVYQSPKTRRVGQWIFNICHTSVKFNALLTVTLSQGKGGVKRKIYTNGYCIYKNFSYFFGVAILEDVYSFKKSHI